MLQFAFRVHRSMNNQSPFVCGHTAWLNDSRAYIYFVTTPSKWNDIIICGLFRHAVSSSSHIGSSDWWIRNSKGYKRSRRQYPGTSLEWLRKALKRNEDSLPKAKGKDSLLNWGHWVTLLWNSSVISDFDEAFGPQLLGRSVSRPNVCPLPSSRGSRDVTRALLANEQLPALLTYSAQTSLSYANRKPSVTGPTPFINPTVSAADEKLTGLLGRSHITQLA